MSFAKTIEKQDPVNCRAHPLKRPQIRRAMHFDFHTMPTVRDVGTQFDAEKFVASLQEAKIEQINFFAKCNLGFAYYPTKIGVVHPGLKTDLLGELTRAAKQAGIAVVAYFNAGLDHEHAMRHREWCKVDATGMVYDLANRGNFSRRLCLNTPYAEYLLGMIDEVLSLYEVEGIFLDCFHFTPCYGYECLHAVRECGRDPLSANDVQETAWEVNRRFYQRVVDLVGSYGDDLTLYFNGMPFQWQPTHLELEVLPSAEWGYDVLPWQIRHARTLGKPYLLMTGRFHGGWGDFGGLRTEHSLSFDCFLALAHGGGCSVGDHLHPRGYQEVAVSKLVAGVFSRIAEYDEWTANVRCLVDLVVICPELRKYPGELFDFSSLAGATRMLAELKAQFNVSDHFDDLENYKVVVLPDHVTLNSEAVERLECFLAGGGIVIASGTSGVDLEERRFLLGGGALVYCGPEVHHPAYFLPDESVRTGLPEMPVGICKQGIAMRSGEGQVLAELVAPYSNVGAWDGFHEDLYNPPDQRPGRPAVVQVGRMIHFGFPIFGAYYDEAITAYKVLFRNCLNRVFKEAILEVEGMPSFGQVSITENEMSFQIHLLSYLPELRGKKQQVIEEPMVVPEVTLRLRLEEENLGQIYRAPSRCALDTGYEAGRVTITVPHVEGYTMVVIEKAGRL